jgi:hypothetical protein
MKYSPIEIFYTEMETTWRAEPVNVMDNEENV